MDEEKQARQTYQDLMEMSDEDMVHIDRMVALGWDGDIDNPMSYVRLVELYHEHGEWHSRCLIHYADKACFGDYDQERKPGKMKIAANDLAVRHIISPDEARRIIEWALDGYSRQWKPYAEVIAEPADNGIKPVEALNFDTAALQEWCDKFGVWLPEESTNVK